MDPDKIPLIRAEWGCKDSDMKAEHAQPHWHIYPSQIKGKDFQKDETFNGEPEVKEFNEFDYEPSWHNIINREKMSNYEKFHFAMASRWHTDGINAHHEMICVKELPIWIEGCIKYTQSQLIYLNKKMFKIY